MTKVQEKLLSIIHEIAQELESGQSALLNQAKELSSHQKYIDDAFDTLVVHLSALENEFFCLKTVTPISAGTEAIGAVPHVKALQARCDEAESRPQRSNLLLFGFADNESKT